MRGAVVHAKLAVVHGISTVAGSSNAAARCPTTVDAVIRGHDTAGPVETLIGRPMELNRWERRGR
jgi:hypothetical protein